MTEVEIIALWNELSIRGLTRRLWERVKLIRQTVSYTSIANAFKVPDEAGATALQRVILAQGRQLLAEDNQRITMHQLQSEEEMSEKKRPMLEVAQA